jgi:hypothetical protein
MALLVFENFAHAQKNTAVQTEIDNRRTDVRLTDDEALARGMEFEKMDSAYYVGYLYEGFFKYSRSADYQGYKNAIPPLQKAKTLFEKQYNPVLKNLFSNFYYLSANYTRFHDYFDICNALKECYDNIEMPDSVMLLLAHLERYHFKKDFFGIYYSRAWAYHRNRIFNSVKFSFLKNSIAENEKMAFKSCYDGLAFIKKNADLNDSWFGANQSLSDKLQIYHVLALLHCYNKNYDSSYYYYQILNEHGAISWNNFAGFQSEVGNFKAAQAFLKMDMEQSSDGDNYLDEPYYYLPELYVFANRTREAVNLCNAIIQKNGSRPGFGWYNIALSRSYMYNAQLDSAQLTLDKAFNFKELHIGTTLTEGQYTFTINLLRINLYDRKIEQLKFLYKNWWYMPTVLYQIGKMQWQKFMMEYNTSIELAFNADRYRMVYDLFCSEATTTYDEAWYLLKDFSPKFFADKYHNYQLTDKRANIKHYFQLFEAMFHYQNGNYNKATEELENILSNTKVDAENEKLFLGRLYESASLVYERSGNQYSRTFYNNLLLETYPQLIPFSGIKMQMRLLASGINDDNTKKIINELHDVNIDWTSDSNAPTASIYFEKKGDRYQATIHVKSANNITVVNNAKLVFGSPKNVAKELALRIFNKGGGVVFNNDKYN